MAVILDANLAELYGVETRRLNVQVHRNIDKFPEDFMFQLTKEGFTNLKSQTMFTSSKLSTVYYILLKTSLKVIDIHLDFGLVFARLDNLG